MLILRDYNILLILFAQKDLQDCGHSSLFNDTKKFSEV